MKILAILEVNPDDVLDAKYPDGTPPDGSVEGAVEAELGWVAESGIYVKEVIAIDSLEPNDTDLGASIRNKMEN